MNDEPRFHEGQRVFVSPQGLAFSGIKRPGIITRVCGLWADPRIDAPETAQAYAYEADITFPNETVNGLVYEYEIVEGR